MKRIFALSIFTCIAFLSFNLSSQAQANLWTWKSGDDITDQMAVYGTKGVADAANKPGARHSSVGWTDAAGNLWMFSGEGIGTSGWGYLNDLWKYLPATKEWTWVNGDNTANEKGIYGVQGIADPGNKPGGRYQSQTWTDASGNFWLFGGYGGGETAYGWLNDMWKYTPSTGLWTWVSGDKAPYISGVYGTKGVSAPSNKPGGTTEAASWIDAVGNLWMFGGIRVDVNGVTDVMNDLWKFSPASGEWTWVSGDNTWNQLGVYGTKGVANATNKPGGRSHTRGWTDASGNFWIFAGYGFDAYGNDPSNILGQTYLNDLWKYSPSANEWTWMGGNNTGNAQGIYGVKGVPDAANTPGARYYYTSWQDAFGNFWLFGGSGFAEIGFGGNLNDVWKYSTQTNQWTWMSGDKTGNVPGVHGTIDIPDASNKPDGRIGSVALLTSCNLWLFGGAGYGTGGYGRFNDLMSFSSCINGSTLPVKLINFSGNLQNDKASLYWNVSQNETGNYFEIEKSTDGLNFVFQAMIFNTLKGGLESYSFNDSIKLEASAFYRLKIVSERNVISYSNIIKLTPNTSLLSSNIKMMQNPVFTSINFTYHSTANTISNMNVYDVSGRKIWSKPITSQKGSNVVSIDIGNKLVVGYYLLEITNSFERNIDKFIKE